MSAYGKFQVALSDDARYKVGETYDILLNNDQTYSVEVAVVQPDAEGPLSSSVNPLNADNGADNSSPDEQPTGDVPGPVS